MMKLGIISDTHDKLSHTDDAFSLFADRGVTAVIHCGDWTMPATLRHIANVADRHKMKLMGVFGNRDDHDQLKKIAASLDEILTIPSDTELLSLTINGLRFIAYHGHHKPTLRKLTESSELDILLTGHTHKPLIQQLDEKLIINPGSTAFSIPRRKEPRSVALFDTKTRVAELIYFEPAQPKGAESHVV